MTLPDPVRAFLASDRKFATIATIDPDGAPRQAVIWYTLDGDDLIINSRAGRRWPSNLLRDARISLAVVSPTDGYQWVGLTGVVTPIVDQEITQADIAAMSRRYHADDPERAEARISEFVKQERISFRIRVVSFHDHLD